MAPPTFRYSVQLLRRFSNRAGVSVQKLKSKRTEQPYGKARQELMYILRSMGYSFPQIGSLLNRDHSTVLYACKRVENEMLLNNEYDKEMKQLTLGLQKSEARLKMRDKEEQSKAPLISDDKAVDWRLMMQLCPKHGNSLIREGRIGRCPDVMCSYKRQFEV